MATHKKINSIDGTDGNDILAGSKDNDSVNAFAGDDSVTGSNGNDVIDGGLGNDTVLAGNGNDVVYDVDGSDSISGGNGKDALDGGVGNDIISGDNGKDVLDGGLGSDLLSGGRGVDVFKLQELDPLNHDTITDFAPVNETIQLAGAVFTQFTNTGALPEGTFALGTAAVDGDDFLIYNQDTGALLYDADANGSGAAIQIATVGVDTHPALTAADFVII